VLVDLGTAFEVCKRGRREEAIYFELIKMGKMGKWNQCDLIKFGHDTGAGEKVE
jgi:hypothetical protein